MEVLDHRKSENGIKTGWILAWEKEEGDTEETGKQKEIEWEN